MSKPKAEATSKPLHRNSRYDYYLCFDVEATCEEGFSFEFPNEVIEFPVVLLDGLTFEIVDEFHSYVQPIHRPILSDFCKELTGISQETIDEAPTFVEVLALFEAWLTKHKIILDEDSLEFAISCNDNGPFDIRDFIAKQCLHSQIPRPSYFTRPYLDIRTRFRDFFDLIQWCNLEGMLTFLGLEFQGRQHSGICDARMVGLIAKELA
ncbi:ribonuclease H-like domain-containing protein, partial [Lobosporangium transversale]